MESRGNLHLACIHFGARVEQRCLVEGARRGRRNAITRVANAVAVESPCGFRDQHGAGDSGHHSGTGGDRRAQRIACIQIAAGVEQ